MNVDGERKISPKCRSPPWKKKMGKLDMIHGWGDSLGWVQLRSRCTGGVGLSRTQCKCKMGLLAPYQQREVTSDHFKHLGESGLRITGKSSMRKLT